MEQMKCGGKLNARASSVRWDDGAWETNTALFRVQYALCSHDDIPSLPGTGNRRAPELLRSWRRSFLHDTDTKRCPSTR